MFTLDIPGHGRLDIQHLVCDYNGTLACDGIVIPDLVPRLRSLADTVAIHVVTADTFGLAGAQCADLPVTLTILPPGDQDQAKLEYVTRLGLASTAAVGNGRNDLYMLQHTALGICIIEAEGASARTLQAADVICRSATDALDLFLNPRRLTATLRR